MPSRVLVVEDEAVRIRWFRARYPECHVTADPPTAIRLLADGDYDALFLDHDLGCEPMAGRDVAQWLAERPSRAMGLKITVHSVNTVSAPKMVADLTAVRIPVQWIPFTHMIGAAVVHA